MADAPGDAGGTPLVPKFIQAFGFQVDADALVARANQSIDMAKSVAGGLQSKITASLIDQTVQAHQAAIALQAKIAGAVAAPVERSANDLAKLQNPIATHVVNTLGSIAESVMPLGVQLPGAGTEAPCPTCVVIRSAAMAGDLGPALQCYRETALPLRDSRPMDYAGQMEYLVKCLPADDHIQSMFSLSVQNIQNEPFPPVSTSASQNAVASATVGEQSVVQNAAGGTSVTSFNACVQAIAEWAGMAQAQIANCEQMLASDPIDMGVCIANVVARANASVPSCAPPGFAMTQGGATFNGLPWSPGQGIPGADPGQFPPSPTPPGQPGPTPGPTPPGSPGGPPGSPGGVPGGPGSPGGTGPVTTPPPSGCDQGFIITFFDQQAQQGITLDVACQNFTAATGMPCYPTASTNCDTGYTFWTVPANSGQSQYVGVCIQCPAPTPPCGNQTVPVPSCGTVQVVVNCPTTGAGPPPTQPSPTPPTPTKPITGGTPEVPSATMQEGCDGLFRFATWTGKYDESYWSDTFLQWANSRPDIFGTGSDLINQALTTFRALAANLSGAALDLILAGLAKLIPLNQSGTPGEAAVIALRALVGLSSKFLGNVTEAADTGLGYAQNQASPFRLPSSAGAATAFLQNEIDAATLRCIVEANGDQWKTFWPLVDGARSKLSAGEYAQLYRRHVLTADEYRTKLREAGFLRDDDAASLYQLTQQIPPPSDLVRFMVRDAGDDALVAKFQLDDQFEDKFTDQLQIWSTQQGVDPTYMRYVWRSHWSIPSPGQLASMLHRLSRLPAGDPAYVDLDTVRQALVQQDIAPFWVDKFVATSYLPLTRIDSRRAFEVGAIDESGLKEAYLNLGYSDANAATLVDYNKKNITRTFLRRPEVTQLAKGQMSDTEFQSAMRQWGASDEAIQAGRDRAGILRSVESRTACVKAFKKRFLQGDFDAPTALARLAGLQIDADTANVILSGWKCELDARGRLFTASQLAQLYADGLIDETDFVRRAIRLGWDNDDAVIMLRQVQRRQGIKAATAQQKELAAEQRATDKLNRQLLQSARRAAADQRRAASQITKAQSVQAVRTKRILGAGEKFSLHSGIELGQAMVLVRSVYNQALQTFPVTADEVIAALTTVAGDKSITDLQSLTDALATALAVAANPLP